MTILLGGSSVGEFRRPEKRWVQITSRFTMTTPDSNKNLFDAVTHMQDGPPHNRFLVPMQLAHPACDSPNTLTALRSRLVASNICLVGENPTCSVPALQGCEGLRSYDYGHASHECTPPALPCEGCLRLWTKGQINKQRHEIAVCAPLPALFPLATRTM